MTIDVTKAIEARSDQLNADDLIQPRTIKITDVKVKEGEQPISIFYEGHNGKPWKPSKTAARCLAYVWSPNASNWIGMRCTIYREPTITWGGAAVGGIMPSHLEGLEKPITIMLAKTRGKKAPITLKPLEEPKAELPSEAKEDEVKTAQQLARDAANEGREAFNNWWKNNANLRDLVRPIMDELKVTVEERESLRDA